MKSALFVDFDNVYSGLRRLDFAYADAFASDPMRWMNWITTQLPMPLEPDAAVKRRILVRRCYLNPVMYQRFRFGFSKAGFEIVDCPPMTTAGKTSTDIHMVLDIVDVLQSETRYDEFIVFSADADFTPVLRKLRRDDRRTTIFAAGATSASYDASSDLIIDPEAFITQALGFKDQDQLSETAPDHDGLMAQAEALTWEVVEKAPGPLLLTSLTKILATQVHGLTDSNWAGRGSFTALLRELPLGSLRIDRETNCILDPRRMKAELQEPAPTPAQIKNPVDVRQQIETILAQEVAASARPVAVARLAHLVRQRCPGIDIDWNGCGTFKRLLETLNPANVEISWAHICGYAFDPSRHSLDFIAQADSTEDTDLSQDDRWGTVAPLLQVANFPAMSASQYGMFLTGLSGALQARQPSLVAATKFIRDTSLDRKVPIPRAHVNTLLRAMLFNGFDLGSSQAAREDLVAMICGIALAACEREGMKVSEPDRQVLINWMTAST
ncbi:MAG: NYN domain-containing protein [Aquabacterium sp.]|nr:NYN domain-containing protein [Aquabacterium sp.]